MTVAGELAGAFLAGFAAAVLLVWWYARRTWRRAQARLAGQLLGLGSTSTGSVGSVEVTRDTTSGYLAGVEKKAREGGGLP